MLRKVITALSLTITLIAMSLMIVSADPPTPGEKPDHKPTVAPGLDKTPGAEKNQQVKDKDNGRHGVFGKVTDKSDKSFTLTTKQGEVFIILVSDKTRFQIPTNKNASFGDLKAEDVVAVNGTPTKNGLEAKKVGIVPGKPSIQHRVGNVKANGNGTLTIADTNGAMSTFTLTSNTEIRSSNGQVSPGDRVTVVSRSNPGGGGFTATAIVVQSN